MMYRVLLIALLLISGCTHHNVRDHIQYHANNEKLSSINSLIIKLPEGPPPFHGDISHHGLDSQPGNASYPGGHPAIFLTSVLAHASVNASSNNNQKNKQQARADKRIEPFKPAIAELNTPQLVKLDELLPENARFDIALLNETPSKNIGSAIVNVSPVFFITQNNKHLILRSKVTVSNLQSQDNDAIIYSNIVEYYSDILEADNTWDYWKVQSNLHNASQELLTNSIQIVLKDIGQEFSPTSPSKTVRYSISNENRYERGQVIQEACGRTVIRTLRGWFKSVPTANALSMSCTSSEKDVTALR